MSHPALARFFGPQRDVLAIHVMKRLSMAQAQRRALTLTDLASELGVRKADVRRVVTALHQQGYVDALRLRLTLAGFAIGAAVARVDLRPMRRPLGAAASSPERAAPGLRAVEARAA